MQNNQKPLVIVGKQAATPPQDPKHIENSVGLASDDK